MPRSKDPNAYPPIFTDILLLMLERQAEIEVPQGDDYLRFSFYAYRNAWADARDKAFHAKDRDALIIAQANYEAMIRYEAIKFSDRLIFRHRTKTQLKYGTPQAHGTRLTEDYTEPFHLNLPDKPIPAKLQGKGLQRPYHAAPNFEQAAIEAEKHLEEMFPVRPPVDDKPLVRSLDDLLPKKEQK